MQAISKTIQNITNTIRATNNNGLLPPLQVSDSCSNKWQNAELIILINPNNSKSEKFNQSLIVSRLQNLPILSYYNEDLEKTKVLKPSIILSSEGDEKLFQEKLRKAGQELDSSLKKDAEIQRIISSARFAAIHIARLNQGIELSNINNAQNDLRDLMKGNNYPNQTDKNKARITNEPFEFLEAYEQMPQVKEVKENLDNAIKIGEQVLEEKKNADLETLAHALINHSSEQKILVLYTKPTDEFLKGMKALCKNQNMSYAVIS